MKVFRPNVAMILEQENGFVLIGERLDIPGSWQFPQGGKKSKETAEEALAREVMEEIGLSAELYRILDSHGPYRYLFPPGRKKEGFDGQEQTVFRARYLGDPALFQGEIESPEFRTLRWIAPAGFRIEWVSPFKQEVYRKLFIDVWGIAL